MTTFLPAYRIILYKVRSEDTTETAVFVPPVGAVHSDEFKVSTVALSGYKEYLALPKGRKGRFDPLKGKYDSPQMTFDLIDKKVSGYSDNLTRWITAFVGDAYGRLKMVGRRMSVEESLDGGATWSPFFAGRISDFSLSGPMTYTLTCRESLSELNQTIFDNQPVSGTSTCVTQLLPIGLSKDYGTIKGAAAYLSGSIQNTLDSRWTAGGLTGGSVFANWLFPRQYGKANVVVFRVSPKSANITDNIASANLQSYLGGSHWKNINNLSGLNLDTGSLQTLLPVQLRSSSLQPWQTFRVVAMTYDRGAFFDKTAIPRVVDIFLTPMSPQSGSTFPQLSALNTGSSQPGYQLRVLPPDFEKITEDNPILIPPTHPARLLQDVVNGVYGLRNPNGTVIRTIPSKATSSFNGDQQNFAYLLTQSYPNASGIISKDSTVTKFIEEYIAPLGIGYRFEAMSTGSTVQAVFVPFDNRLPETLPSDTISNDDLAHATNVQWSIGSPFPYALTTAYLDVGFTYSNDTLTPDKRTDFPSLNPSKIVSHPIKFFSLERLSDGDALDTYDNNIMKLDVPSLRLTRISADEDTTDDLDAYVLGGGVPYFNSAVWRVVDHFENRFANGPVTVTLKCRRNDNIDDLQLGQWVQVDVDVLPDQSSHLRGGIRLMQITEKSEDGLSITIGLTDAGPNARLIAPLVGPLSGSGFSRVDVPVTLLTGSVRLVLDTAIVPMNQPQPDETSSLWRQTYNAVRNNSGSFTQSLSVGRASSSVYVRGQVQSIGRTPTFRAGVDAPPTIQIPSTWTYTSAKYNGTTITAPTGLAYSIDGRYATLQWTGSTDNITSVVTVSAPTSSTAQIVRVLDSVTDRVTVGPYPTSANPIRVSVYQADGLGGLSASQSVAFYTSASSTTVNVTPTPLNVEFITLA